MRAAATIVIALLCACGGGTTVVQGVSCKSDKDCNLEGTAGMCESDGYCAYPDSSCAGGLRYSPGAPSSDGCVGGPAACGIKDASCCSGSLCGANLTCASDTCACGAKDQACCDGTTCGANLTCGSDLTCACGGAGQACCDGATCGEGLACGMNGTCAATAVQVALGRAHTCVLLSDKTVECWGVDALPFGRDIPGVRRSVIDLPGTPTRVPNLTDVAEIESGETTTCARKTDNTLWCWGHGESGQLGNGATQSSWPAVQVSGLTDVTMFDVGRQTACAVGTVGGTAGLYCWGRGGRGNLPTPGANPEQGRLGNGATDDHATPVAVDLSMAAAAGQTIKSLSVGGHASCIVMSDNTVWCWGVNDSGALGNNTTDGSNVPTEVDLSQITIPAGTTIDQVSTSEGNISWPSTCMLLSDGTVYCWGYGAFGELGDGTTNQYLRPTAPVITTGLPAGVTFTQIASAMDAHCALASDSTVWCWGRNQQGELGINDTNPGAHPTPAQVVGLAGVTRIDVNHHTACAIDTGHQVYCWGNNRAGEATIVLPTTVAETAVLQPMPLAL